MRQFESACGGGDARDAEVKQALAPIVPLSNCSLRSFACSSRGSFNQKILWAAGCGIGEVGGKREQDQDQTPNAAVQPTREDIIT